MTYTLIFAQSCLLELPTYLWFLKRCQPPSGTLRVVKSDGHTFAACGVAKVCPSLLLVVGMNSVTHPVVFFGVMNLPLTYLQNILLAEGFAVLSEAWVLWRWGRLSWQAAGLASLIANLISWQFAPVLTYLWAR